MKISDIYNFFFFLPLKKIHFPFLSIELISFVLKKINLKKIEWVFLIYYIHHFGSLLLPWVNVILLVQYGPSSLLNTIGNSFPFMNIFTNLFIIPSFVIVLIWKAISIFYLHESSIDLIATNTKRASLSSIFNLSSEFYLPLMIELTSDSHIWLKGINHA